MAAVKGVGAQGAVVMVAKAEGGALGVAHGGGGWQPRQDSGGVAGCHM